VGSVHKLGHPLTETIKAEVIQIDVIPKPLDKLQLPEEIGELVEPKLSDSFINLWYLVGAALCGRPVWGPTEELPYEIFNLQ
jgi:hypothetical protein